MDTGKSTRKGNEGYYTLEAAIFLPIFIVAVLTIGFFMKLIGAEEKIMHSGTDEARYLAVEAYEIKTSLGFSGTLERRILKENEELDQVQVSNLQFLYAKGGIDGLISFDVEGEMEIPLPIGLYQGFTL
ncbi:MAG: hypothetical protein RR661_01920, partial [Anaerovoracaceae bacterium]